MKIAFYGLEDQWKKDFFAQTLSEYDLEMFDACLAETAVTTPLDYEVLSIFVGCKVTKKVLDNMPNLKFIAVRSTGFDNVDINECKSRGILVANVPAYGSHTVSEFTFALITALSRRVPEAVKRVKEEGRFEYEGLRGFDLNEKTLGVVGTGRIGQNVIKIARGFNMRVLAYDAFPNYDMQHSLEFEYADLGRVLGESDVVTIHAPYNEQTHHLINKENIWWMKNGAYIINTARGAIVETEALFQAITKNHLAGAALDVVEEENVLKDEVRGLEEPGASSETYRSIIQNHILIDLPNVIITPHMAFFSKEAEDAIQQTTVDNIHAFITNNPQNVVNK